jgi:peroxiredoxin
MRFSKLGSFLAIALLTLGLGSFAHAAKVGEAAPAFTATGSDGKTYNLSDFQGKWVVLEWHNPECPFVVSQYKGKMQKLQAKWTKKGVIWLTVNSSAAGMEGNLDAAGANADIKATGAHVTAALLDADGTVGHAYGAKTTPHMFVIDPKGILVYNGAIDNAPHEDAIEKKTESGDAYVNYVDLALKSGLAGKPIATQTTASYGCGVKYSK